MRVKLTSVSIADQEQALAFYTDVLGFVKKRDIPMGQARFLTVVAPDDPDGAELMLEPNAHYPPMRSLKEALRRDGHPFIAFEVDDVQREYQRLVVRGVTFTQPPTRRGPSLQATFDDTCGNLIQIYQVTPTP